MPQRIKPSKRSAVIFDLGQTDYGRALSLQYELVELKIEEPDRPDYLILLDHPPVFTLGKNGGAENLMVSEGFLNEKNIEVVQTTRGGNITYHGPGQAVFYPIVHLDRAGIGVKDFVHGLEEVLIRTIEDFGIRSDRNSKNHGVWIQDKKIASVGISIKKGICFHGMALNAMVDLTPFSWINPCGMQNVAMTSIRAQLESENQDGTQLSLKKVFSRLLTHFTNIFEYTIETDEISQHQENKQTKAFMA